MPDQPLSRGISMATGAYAIFAGLRPSHLAGAVQADEATAHTYDRLARTYAARDIGISALGAFGPSPVVPVSIALRILNDVGDAWALGSGQEHQVRRKVMAVALGWGVLNTAALLIDRHRATK